MQRNIANILSFQKLFFGNAFKDSLTSKNCSSARSSPQIMSDVVTKSKAINKRTWELSKVCKEFDHSLQYKGYSWIADCITRYDKNK